jgi:hypothetical protein
MSDVNLPLPFESYTGSEPFIFVSYAHKDAGIVYKELAWLYQQNYRVWFDEGIDPGNEWPDEIANAISSSSFFIVFITENAVSSVNVRNEINFALNRQKPFLAIHLSDTSLPSGLELRMGGIQAILKYRMPDESYQRKIIKVLSPTLRGSDEAPTISLKEEPKTVMKNASRLLFGINPTQARLLLGDECTEEIDEIYESSDAGKKLRYNLIALSFLFGKLHWIKYKEGFDLNNIGKPFDREVYCIPAEIANRIRWRMPFAELLKVFDDWVKLLSRAQMKLVYRHDSYVEREQKNPLKENEFGMQAIHPSRHEYWIEFGPQALYLNWMSRVLWTFEFDDKTEELLGISARDLDHEQPAQIAMPKSIVMPKPLVLHQIIPTILPGSLPTIEPPAPPK